MNNDLIDYDHKFSEHYNEELKSKKAKFKELEYQVFKIKNTTVIIQNEIEKIKLIIVDLNNKVKVVRKKNIKLNDDRRSIRKVYLQTKIQLLQIFKRLKFKSLDETITHFNSETHNYLNHFSSVEFSLN